MPGLDQTGPVGYGPMSGRARGRCTDSAGADRSLPAYGRGRRQGYRIGRGPRWEAFPSRGGHNAPLFFNTRYDRGSEVPPEHDQLASLEDRAANLERALSDVKTKIAALEAKATEE